MRKIILTAFVSIFSLGLCYSQDIITKKTNEEIKAKVLEVSTTEIKYKKFNAQDDSTFIVLKSDIIKITYENGTKDIFNSENSTNDENTIYQPNTDLYAQGQMDASKYYKGYKAAGSGTLVASLLIPIVGLIPAIACSSTMPSDANLMYPDASLMKKNDYYLGYTEKAKKIKQGKVWMNWGIAFGANLVAVLLLSQNSTNTR